MSNNETRIALMKDLATLALAYEEEGKLTKKMQYLKLNEDKRMHQMISKKINTQLLKIAAIVFVVLYIASYIIHISSLLILIAFIFMGFRGYKFIRKQSASPKSALYKKYSEQYRNNDETNQQVKRQIQNILEDKNALHRELNQTGIGQRIPAKYAEYFPVVKMFEYLENHRADTLKEAINLYELESHQMRMEGSQKEILKTTKETLLEAASANVNAMLAAGAAASASRHAEKASKNSSIAKRNTEEILSHINSRR